MEWNERFAEKQVGVEYAYRLLQPFSTGDSLNLITFIPTLYR